MAIIVTQVCKKNVKLTAFLSLCRRRNCGKMAAPEKIVIPIVVSLFLSPLSQHVKMCITHSWHSPGRRRQLFISIYAFLCGQLCAHKKNRSSINLFSRRFPLSLFLSLTLLVSWHFFIEWKFAKYVNWPRQSEKVLGVALSQSQVS
jgi:hypothetical protein